MYSENLTQSCVYYCPYNSTYLSYSDSFKTNRCVAKCPDLYFGDNSTGYGQCLSVCTGLNFFRDNTTQICVFTCPKANATLGSVSNTAGGIASHTEQQRASSTSTRNYPISSRSQNRVSNTGANEPSVERLKSCIADLKKLANTKGKKSSNYAAASSTVSNTMQS